MKICVFNPDHDIVLGSNVKRFTPPHAARRLRRDLQYLPALWANDGDKVLVEDVQEALVQSRIYQRYMANVEFIDQKMLSQLPTDEYEIDPWGWDRAIAERFGDLSTLNADQVEAIREASSRVFFSEKILPEVVSLDERLLGVSHVVTNYEDLGSLLGTQNGEGNFKYVVKAPWSSSGRGVRYIDMHDADYSQNNMQGWIKNIMKQQGAVTVEPFYHKVKDFGLEFYIHEDGKVDYCGLSLFETVNGQYIGNILDTEEKKEEMLERYVSKDLFDKITSGLCEITSSKLKGIYTGPFGVDLMVVTHDNGYGFRVAFAELNLRRTMGHVALSLSKHLKEQRVMRIEMNDRYRLHLYKRKGEELEDSLEIDD